MFQKILSFFVGSSSESRRDFFKGIGSLSLASLLPTLRAKATVIFPMIRRVTPELIHIESVEVKPMEMPAASIFYQDYTYGRNRTDREC